MALTFENPIVIREFRSRMRGGRAVWLQFLYVAVLIVVVAIAYLAATANDTLLLTTGRLGRQLFDSLCVAQGTLLALTAPAFAAGSFTIEREQQTLDTLLVSPLRTGRIVRGKLAAATLFLALLLTISVPLLALTFLFGGVSPNEVIGTYAIQLANGILLGAVGLGWSLVCKGTAAATMATYATVVTYLTFFSPLAAGAEDGFLLAAMSPVTASLTTGYSAVMLGHPLPLWLPSLAAVLFLAAWALDVAACRAHRIRNGRRSGRPRVWLATAATTGAGIGVATALGWGRTTSLPSAELRSLLGTTLLFAICGGSVVALVLCADDVDASDCEPGRWWAVWRDQVASGPLFVALTPLAVWPAIGYYAATHAVGPEEYVSVGIVITLVAMTTLAVAGHLIRFLNELMGRRWPAVAVGAFLLAAICGGFGILTGIALSSEESIGMTMLGCLSPFTCIVAAANSDKTPFTAADAMTLATSVILANLLLAWSLSRLRRRWSRPAVPPAPSATTPPPEPPPATV